MRRSWLWSLLVAALACAAWLLTWRAARWPAADDAGPRTVVHFEYVNGALTPCVVVRSASPGSAAGAR